MKKVLKKIISIIILIILLGTFEAPNIIQTVYAATEYIKSNDRGDIFENVYSDGELENIMPFTLRNYSDTIQKEYLVGEFEKAGKTVRNESELQDIIGTGTKIVTNYETYIVLIYGDVDGDGEITPFDAQSAFRHDIRGGKYTLTGIYEIAGNVLNYDDVVDTFDAERIFKFSVGNKSVPNILYRIPEYPKPTPTPTPTPNPTTRPPVITTPPQEPLTLTATLESKTDYFYYENHTVTLSGKRGNNTERITSADVKIVDENGSTVSAQNAQITNKTAQSDGTYTLTFVAKVAGTYKVIATVSGKQAEVSITIKDNPVIDKVIFGSKENPQDTVTLTIGQTKQIPLIFENEQGVQLTPATITTNPIISGINANVTDGILTIEGVSETPATKLNIVADNKTVGTITVNVIQEITSVTSSIFGQKFLTGNKYPVTIAINNNTVTEQTDILDWEIYKDGNTTTPVEATVADVVFENKQYQFIATEAGSYVIKAIVKETGLGENITGKVGITVDEDNSINKIEIVNEGTTITISNKVADKSIDIYTGDEPKTLPITFKHDNKVINPTIGDISLSPITNATITKKAAEGKDDGNGEALARLEIIGTTAGRQELEIKQGEELIGTVTINVINPLFKVTPVATPVKMIVGTTTEKEDGMTIDGNKAYTLFKVEKVDENGVKRGKVTKADIVTATEKLIVTITNGETTLLRGNRIVRGFVADDNGDNATLPTGDEITHIGISITKQDINIDAQTTIKISYKDLKTFTNENEYTFGDVTVTKATTT